VIVGFELLMSDSKLRFMLKLGILTMNHDCGKYVAPVFICGTNIRSQGSSTTNIQNI